MEIKSGVAGPPPTAAFQRALRAAVASEIDAERGRRRIRRVLAAVGSLAAVLMLAVGLWAALRLDARGGSPAGLTGAHVAGASPKLPERWRYEGARSARASPADSIVVRGSSMYLVTSEGSAGRVVAVDTATGRRRWVSQSPSFGYLATDGSRVFCLAKGRQGPMELSALGCPDGQVLWRCSYEGPAHTARPCRPVPLSGGRVCWTIGKEVRLLDADTGAVEWVRSFADEGPPSRAVAHGSSLYVATGKALTCLDVTSGHTTWRRRHDGGGVITRRPLLAVAGERIYFTRMGAGGSTGLLCVDADSRELVWRRSVPGASCLLATAHGVYLRSQRIMAVSPHGEVLWARAAQGCGPLSVVDSVIHFVDTRQRGRVVALEPRTGRIAREIPGIRSCDAFTCEGDTGYVKTQDGVVHAIAMADASRS